MSADMSTHRETGATQPLGHDCGCALLLAAEFRMLVQIATE